MTERPEERRSRPRRVLVVHPSPDLYGSDRMLLESVAAFDAAGWDVDVVLPGDGPLVAELAVYRCRIAWAPMVVLRKAFLRPAGLVRLAVQSARSVLPTLRLIASSDPDLVYVNTLTIPGWLLAGRVAGRRVLAHVHEAESEVPRTVAVGLAAPLLAAHRVVVNSKATGAVLAAAIPALGRRTDLVHNGVAGPEHPAPPRERLDGEVRLVVVGRLSPRKGTDVAVDALARLREQGVPATLTLVGAVFPGYEWFEQQLRDQVHRRGLDAVVTFTGFVPDPSEALAGADIALVPSRVEPFGNTAIEAQLALRPVIVSATQGLVETVDDGRWGSLAAPGDAEDLAARIRELVDAWPAALERARSAREHAVAAFSPRQFRRALLAVADGVAAPPRQGRPSAR
ncbi:glycosyl transferase [Tersicoccus solisilvae]|uniref:Glycosyl transferase n=1 Tax=Tersicoccus solisilvae TaxID=1882339 RepID=A0ABQ1PMM7_9MICC|nr:glycosyltransferase family 4 protein [Tersicoccus solisilvae]GGC99875.1 glycosyl transferase [Tersicoccus solisilvae]